MGRQKESVVNNMQKQMSERQKFWLKFKKQKVLHLIVLMGLVYIIIFSYVPMTGIIIAFKKYKLTSGVLGFFTSPWVGLKWFNEFFKSPKAEVLIRNTLVLSSMKLIIGFPLPIVFALMLNEIRSRRFKSFVQTASYLPHFISWIIVSGLCYTMFSSVNGVVNEVLLKLGLIDKGLTVLTSESQYWGLAFGTSVWKSLGWDAIIFIAAITGIDPALYEAAEIDGAGRLKRILYVTLPGIKGTIIIMFILSLGGLVNGNLSQALLLGNGMNNGHSEIIDSYVLTMGLSKFRFDFAAAVGLMQSVISVILVFSANRISRKISGASLY